MIFKTINSSVDETRKTLALFNKDWNTYKRNWQNANGVFGKIGSVFTPANAISKSDIEAIKAYNSQIDSCVTSQTAFNRTMLNANPAAQNLVASYNGRKVSAQGIATAQNAAKASTIGLTLAQTALNAAIGMGSGLLVSLVVKGIDKLVHANEEAIQKAEELRRKYEEFKSTNESNISTLNGLKKEFEELSEGVSQYGDNVSLTTEQYERYKEIIQQIVGMSPALAEGYSTENGYIVDKNGLLERAIELQEQEYRNELRKITNLDNLKTSMSGYIAEYKEAFNGGLVTDDMSAISTTTATDFSNALYDVFNLGGSGKHNYDNTEKIARKIIESLGIEDINSEIQKFINKNGNFESSWFFKAYADTIAENIEVITDSLSADTVGLDDTVFDQNIEKVDSAAQSYLDMKDAISMANESIQRDLSYIAKYADGYSNLSTEQQKFVNEFLKCYDISDIMSESNNPFNQGWKFDEDKMASVKSQITKFVEALSQDETTKSALDDLYAIPTDEQSISEFVEQFRNALEVIKAYCKDNGIEVPIAITDSEQTINNLEAQYQRAVDFAKDKFNGYDPTAFFKEHSINTQEEIDAWQKIAQGARDAAEAEKEYLNQTPKESPTLFTQLTTSKESLDKFQSSVKSASDAYATLLSGNYSSSELLSSIQTINQAVNEMDGSLNWKFINNQADSLEVLGEAIQCVSTKYANSILSDAGIDIDSDFGKMLAEMIIQAFEAETAFAGMNSQLDNLQSSYQTLTGIIESYNETGYISLDNLQSLLTADENLITMLEVENGQLAINQEAYENLVAAQLMEFKAKLNDAAAAEIEALAKNKAEQATNSNASASNNAVEKLDAETAAINRNTSAAISNAVAKAEESGVSAGEIQGVLDKYNEIWNATLNNFSGDFSGFMGGGKKSAGKSGKEAADAYLEAFEKELKDLDDLKDRGRISEKQYLDALRRLYLKYFRDKEKYLKEYGKYENQYLDGMKSLYESAFSYITKQIDKRIDAIHAEKDAAVSGLEAERDASLEAIEAEKEQHENEIGGIEKQIDAKEKEVKAMQDANAERRRAIDLQKAEYELQRMQNQKTSLVYKDGQMSYEADTSGIRDAKQEVDDAKLEIDISKIEEEIGLLEDEKDLIQERIDLLDKEADRINEYYDKLIADTEKHYDAMAKGLEDYRAQFGELTELLETAQMEATLFELGISMDALLSGSQEEFEKLKTAYTGILADMGRGNDGVLEQLSRLSGISAESISYLDATRGAFEGLGGVTLEGLEESVDGIGESVSTLSTSAGEASAAVGNIQESVSGASQSIAPLNTELGNLKTLIGELIELLSSIQFPEIGGEGYVQKLRDTAQAFGEIASKCAAFQNIDFSSIIGSASVSGTDGAAMPDGEGAEGQTGTGFMGLASAISEAATTIDEQMDRLKKALDTGNDAFTEQIRIIHEEYIPAWEELQTRLAEIIGVGGGNGDNKEGEGKQKSGNKGRSSESGRNDGSIIDIMQTGGEEVAKKLEDPWLKAFHDFATDGDNSVQSICDKIIELVTEMARIIQEQCEAAANSLRSLAETAASSLSSAGSSGSVSGNTVSGNTIPVFPKAEGTVGNAFAKGTGKYKGLPHNEKNALRSEYGQPELTVYPDGKAELTTEPVISNLPKGTVIFNEEQTRRIMENKGEMIGHAYDGETITLLDGRKIRPLNSSDEPYWMQKKLESYFAENRDAFLRPGNAMSKAAESMDRAAETIHNNHVMKQSIHVDVGGVHVHGVQNPEEFSDVVNLRIHNKILQEINKW